MDYTLLIAIAVIFLSAIISVYLRSRNLDACLKDFQDFQVTLEEKDGDIAWGKLRVYPTGLELLYKEPNYNRDGHIETSYIYYKEQYPSMYALYRYAEEMTEDERKRRRQQIEALIQRPWLMRLTRNIRNGLAIFKDAVLQTLGIVMGQVKRTAPGSIVLRNHEKELQNLSKDIIGHVGNAFEPLLEKYIGRQVVLEITREGVTTEKVGILKNYTANFIEVLDIRDTQRMELPLAKGELAKKQALVELEVDGQQVLVRNRSKVPVYVRAVRWDQQEHPVDVVVQPGLVVDFGLETLPPEDARVVVEVARRFDLVVPRSHAIIRHCAETEQDNWMARLLKKIVDEEGRETESRTTTPAKS